jgi:sigma-B regulation protein RsbU (phosphoserine phosphatase)
METLVLDPEKTRTSATVRILIADDQPDVVEALRLLLKGEGYEAEGVSSPAAVLQALAAGDFDLLLLDLNYTRDTTSGVEGLDLLSRIKASGSILPVVVMTAWGSVELAVEAMHRGVSDFVLKPWNNRQLLEILRTQLEQGASRRRQLQDEERELEDVEAVQRGFLPKEIPQLAGYEISGAWFPARVVGGDYFDIYAFSESKLAMSIADVSGKGMSAALLMSNLQAALKATASGQALPEQVCDKVNRIICGNVSPGRFITAFYGLLDASCNRLVFTNAGHNAPILARRVGSWLRLGEGGPPLGLFSEWNYGRGEIQLAAGDRLVLFTDGVTEVSNAAGEEFGEERLVTVLMENRHLSAGDLQEKILAEVAKFSGGRFQDDATLVVVAVADEKSSGQWLVASASRAAAS